MSESDSFVRLQDLVQSVDIHTLHPLIPPRGLGCLRVLADVNIAAYSVCVALSSFGINPGVESPLCTHTLSLFSLLEDSAMVCVKITPTARCRLAVPATYECSVLSVGSPRGSED